MPGENRGYRSGLPVCEEQNKQLQKLCTEEFPGCTGGPAGHCSLQPCQNFWAHPLYLCSWLQPGLLTAHPRAKKECLGDKGQWRKCFREKCFPSGVPEKFAFPENEIALLFKIWNDITICYTLHLYICTYSLQWCNSLAFLNFTFCKVHLQKPRRENWMRFICFCLQDWDDHAGNPEDYVLQNPLKFQGCKAPITEGLVCGTRCLPCPLSST